MSDTSLYHIKDGFSASRTGLGVKFGTLWLLWSCVTIDWNFFGLGEDYYSLKLYSEGTINQGGETYSEQDIEKDGIFMPGFNTDFSIGYTF